MARSPVALTSFALLALTTASLAGPPAQPTQRKSDLAQGKDGYERHCQACHGAHAAGDGPATAQLVVAVPDLRGKLDDEPTDAAITRLLAGSGTMPGYEQSLDDYTARRVLRWMARAAATVDEPASPAAELPAPKPTDP